MITLTDFLVMLVFSTFGVLFSIEKAGKKLELYHVLVVGLFSSSVSFGLSYFMYIKYGIELDNRIVYTASTIIGFAFEYFTIEQIIKSLRAIKNIKVTFKK